MLLTNGNNELKEEHYIVTLNYKDFWNKNFLLKSVNGQSKNKLQ